MKMSNKKNKLKINFTYPSKDVFRREFKKILLLFRKKWIYFSIWFLTLAGSLVSFSIAESTLKSSSYENLYTSITETANKQKTRRQNLTISAKEASLDYSDIKSFMSIYNSRDDQNYPFSCVLTLSSVVNEHAFQISSDGEVLKDKTLISPKTFGLNEYNGFYRIDSIPIDVLYSSTYRTGNGMWCLISTKYAEELMQEWNISNMEDLIGKDLNAYYKIKGTTNKVQMYIGNIYDASRGEASHMTNLYGDFVLSYTLNFRNIDNINLSVTLRNSLAQNNATIKLLLDKFPIQNFNYKFMRENSDNIWNEVLEQNLYDYLYFDETINHNKYVACLVIAMICFLVSSICLANIALQNIKYKFLSYKRFVSLVFIVVFSFIAILYVSIKYIFKNPVLCIGMTKFWLIVLFMEVAYLSLFWILERKRRENHEIKNEMD